VRLAHIAPTSLLTFGALPLTQSAFFCISEMVVKSSAYANYYRDQVRKGAYVILDNPVHENRPYSSEEWLLAVGYVNPPIAVIPDVIDDTKATVENARRLIPQLQERSPMTTPLLVPHGVTHVQFMDCALRLLEVYPNLTYLGLTLERRLKDDELAYGRRRWRLMQLREDERFNDVRIHYLGVSEAAHEFSTDELDLVYSADTSKFVVRALTGTSEEPPGPILSAYPGRKALGGSFGYLNYSPPELVLDPPKIWAVTKSLAEWSAAAEGKR